MYYIYIYFGFAETLRRSREPTYLDPDQRFAFSNAYLDQIRQQRGNRRNPVTTSQPRPYEVPALHSKKQKANSARNETSPLLTPQPPKTQHPGNLANVIANSKNKHLSLPNRVSPRLDAHEGEGEVDEDIHVELTSDHDL